MASNSQPIESVEEINDSWLCLTGFVLRQQAALVFQRLGRIIQRSVDDIYQISTTNTPSTVTSPATTLLLTNHALDDESAERSTLFPIPCWKISLDLERWAALPDKDIESPIEQRARIKEILTFFIEIAVENGLTDSAAVPILTRCLEALEEAGEFRGKERDEWRDRICQRTAVQVEADIRNIEQDRNRLLGIKEGLTDQFPSTLVPSQYLPISPGTIDKQVPLFNMWDAMSFVYTKCVEPIYDSDMAELHLYQFWTIVRALKRCSYFASFASPTTAAAAWSEARPAKEPFVIAFATTCVGGGPSTDKSDMARVRRGFITRLKSILQGQIVIRCPKGGNCPEFVIWSQVVTVGGKYQSLCLGHSPKDKRSKSLKFCDLCKEQADFLKDVGVDIGDLWMQTGLRDITIDPVFETEYPYCLLDKGSEILDRARRRRLAAGPSISMYD